MKKKTSSSEKLYKVPGKSPATEYCFYKKLQVSACNVTQKSSPVRILFFNFKKFPKTAFFYTTLGRMLPQTVLFSSKFPAGHCVKIVQIQSFFLFRVFPYLDWIRTRKKSVFVHFSRSRHVDNHSQRRIQDPTSIMEVCGKIVNTQSPENSLIVGI